MRADGSDCNGPGFHAEMGSDGLNAIHISLRSGFDFLNIWRLRCLTGCPTTHYPWASSLDFGRIFPTPQFLPLKAASSSFLCSLVLFPFWEGWVDPLERMDTEAGLGGARWG